MDFLIILAILLVVVLLVSAPLRHAAAVAGDPSSPDADVPPAPADPNREAIRELADLGATREAKYREIRDAELDYRTGKLSHEDYEAIDLVLRAEAIEILHALDLAQARAGATIGER